jgi:hypothetical protein
VEWKKGLNRRECEGVLVAVVYGGEGGGFGWWKGWMRKIRCVGVLRMLWSEKVKGEMVAVVVDGGRKKVAVVVVVVVVDVVGGGRLLLWWWEWWLFYG